MTNSVPVITVVVPALNAEATIADQLQALALQDFDEPWELVIVDNGSTDRTAEIAGAAPSHSLCLKLTVSEPIRGLNAARNAGIFSARSSRIALCDADDIVEKSWLSAIYDGLNEYDMVGGALSPRQVNSHKTATLRGWDMQGEPMASIGTEFGFLDQVVGASVGFRRSLWQELGGFDESFTRGGDDVDFAWRAQLNGFTLGYCPDALLYYRGRPDRWPLFRQYTRDGEGGAHLYSVYRHHGMPGRPLGRAFRTTISIIGHSYCLVRGSAGEQGKLLRVAGKQFGRIRGSIRHRVMYL
jgi:GT2 family glycosyltransferase